MVTQMKKSPVQSLVYETLIIAALTLAGYVIVYAYEIGYFSYYGIPWGLVEIENVRAFAFTAILLIVFMICFAWVVIFPDKSESKKIERNDAWSCKKLIILFLVICALIILFLYYFSHPDTVSRMYLFLGPILLIFSCLALELDKIPAKKFSTVVGIASFLLTVDFIIGSFCLGTILPSRLPSLPSITIDTQSYQIVRMYHDRLIAIPYSADRKAKITTIKIINLNAAENADIDIQLK